MTPRKPVDDERYKPRRPDTEGTPLFPTFTDPALQFADEDGFLHGCDIHAEALERRVRSAHTSVRVFRLGRSEMQLIADNYARAVAIARFYHLAEANRRAELARKESAA